jgi:hypothetical protein
MLTMSEDAMQIPAVIAGTVVSAADMFNEQACLLAVLLGLVVLLAVLYESPLAPIGCTLAGCRDALRFRRFVRARLQLLSKPGPRLGPMITLGVVLWSWLMAPPVR